MEFDDLTDEQKAKVMSCKTADELIALAEADCEHAACPATFARSISPVRFSSM